MKYPEPRGQGCGNDEQHADVKHSKYSIMF